MGGFKLKKHLSQFWYSFLCQSTVIYTNLDTGNAWFYEIKC